MIRQRFSGGARAAVALFGTRIAAGSKKQERPKTGDRKPPDWIAELDDEEGIDEFELAMRSDLGEALEERIGEPPDRHGRPAHAVVERSR